MVNDVLTVIQNSRKKFSKGQTRIADYICESYDKAAFLTASKLGSCAGVSESTVVRFALDLGYPGYPALQKDLQELVLQKLTSVQRMESANDRIGDKDIVNLVMQQDINMMQATMEQIDRDVFNHSVDALFGANRIYILGVRSSSTIAYYMNYYFNLMFDNVRMINASSPSEMFEQLSRVSNSDVVIPISFPRYSRSTVQATEYCSKIGATIIAITDSSRSPVAPYATMLLPAKMNAVSLVESLAAPLSLVNALIVSIARRRGKEMAETFSKLESIWEEYGVYEKTEK